MSDSVDPGEKKTPRPVITSELVAKFKEELGSDGIGFFRNMLKEHGKVNPVITDNNGFPHPVHFREGITVRNILRGLTNCAWTGNQYDDYWTEVVMMAIEESKDEMGFANAVEAMLRIGEKSKAEKDKRVTDWKKFPPDIVLDGGDGRKVGFWSTGDQVMRIRSNAKGEFDPVSGVIFTSEEVASMMLCALGLGGFWEKGK